MGGTVQEGEELVSRVAGEPEGGLGDFGECSVGVLFEEGPHRSGPRWRGQFASGQPGLPDSIDVHL